MKTLILITSLIMTLITSQSVFSQTKRVPASAGRAEYVEVEPGVKLHVTDLGDGQPIVLIHGWPLSDEMYQYQYQYLVRKGFRVIGISLRGFGKSDKPYGKYNFDVFSDDIYAVLHTLKIENAVLGGFSMGGAASIHYVNKYKSAHISKLALFGAAAPSWKQRPGYSYGISEENAAGLIKQTMTSREDLIAGLGAAFAAEGTTLPPNTEKWLENINLSASPYAVTESIASLGELDLRPVLKDITIPVAIFQGVKDKLIEYAQAEQLHKGLKNSYIVRFEKSGHALFVEEMDKFNSELEKFARK
ncbi:alpha/beta fold hydrolase [Chitinophaga ginsengisegetis]|uniref:alpha/beta fold hydrolase n=1 Tax=Chitinophaga ginsengisegetis TaxID=393003 RepID=UPI000DB9501A|nr:alpha/beta hydrolase [Chitinophaga ginsengisegetis]MDR6565495.1 pimeloyl-ACP methyl ester carboxylesterase [Chitinophaga ginsengisegetis]MDR6645224.1 pimeloyl-ACP methyl ester carboxylesterase [Chitinophaga ginsengisegetis]MDR6652185.1 pimeloyl-ACP methyl ester carboxylesterase [Chitinophaga ginsengisegetis]